MGLFKAQSLMSNKPSLVRATKDITFMSLSNLITALLSELAKTYVYGATEFDVSMRSKIAKTIEIVNNYQEVSQILIKGDPFKDHSS